jgi:hypothetical protein
MAANGKSSGKGTGKVAADFEKLIHEGMLTARRSPRDPKMILTSLQLVSARRTKPLLQRSLAETARQPPPPAPSPVAQV